MYSSSSADSIASNSNDEIYAEELVEDEGESELVLVRRREVRVIEWHGGGGRYSNYVRIFILQSSDNVHEEMDEEILGGLGYTDFFLACVSSLKAEELIRRSPRGKRVGLLLDELNRIEVEKVAEIAISLISKASGCIISGYKHKLPSAAQSSVWSTFHQLRGSQEMKQIWGVFVSSHLPESCRQESELALQLLLDRLLKKLLHSKADAKKTKQCKLTSQLSQATHCNGKQCRQVYVWLCGSKPIEEIQEAHQTPTVEG